MSLFGAVVRGLVLFAAMTASLAVALFIAITGPPSNDEMAGVRAAADQALNDAGVAAEKFGDSVCKQLSGDMKDAAGCPAGQARAEKVARAPPTLVPAAPLPPEPTPFRLAQTETAQATTIPVVAAPVRVTPRPHPHSHPQRATRPAHTTPAAARHPRPRGARATPASTHVAAPRHPPPRRPAPQRVTHAPPPPPRTSPTASSPPPQAAHATPAVAQAASPPPPPRPIAVAHPQLAGPEPAVVQAPASAAPPDQSDPPASDPPPEKANPTP